MAEVQMGHRRRAGHRRPVGRLKPLQVESRAPHQRLKLRHFVQERVSQPEVARIRGTAMADMSRR